MTRDEFLEALFRLDPVQLDGTLPPPLAEAMAADPALAAEVEALRTMDRAMPLLGRPLVDPNLFVRQRNQVLALVQAARLEEQKHLETRSWAAPRGSLVLLLGVVAGYILAGVEGGLLGVRGAEMAVIGGPDPMDCFLAVYACLLGLAAYVFHMDGRVQTRVPVALASEA
jgi:hypothetical protein